MVIAGSEYTIVVEHDLIVIRVIGRCEHDVFAGYALQEIERVAKEEVFR